ncbi:MAG: polysaccharide deacetylase family protein [Promethearchaeota archaeon]
MKIALTFDIERDIPNVLDTSFGIEFGLVKILKILDDFNIKGTFFCTGNIANRLPKYIKLIIRQGHEIACHGLNHERLTKLDFEECEEIITQNKKILEKVSQSSEIIGFRAPYLKVPNYLFIILKNQGFKYDSSINHNSIHILKNSHGINGEIQEFHPNLNIIFRLPLSYSPLRKWIYKKELLVLYVHPWEAIEMRSLLFNQIELSDILKNALFRPDRWINTGDMFLYRFKSFIRETLSKKAEFVMLKQLVK